MLLHSVMVWVYVIDPETQFQWRTMGLLTKLEHLEELNKVMD